MRIPVAWAKSMSFLSILLLVGGGKRLIEHNQHHLPAATLTQPNSLPTKQKLEAHGTKIQQADTS